MADVASHNTITITFSFKRAKVTGQLASARNVAGQLASKR
jgi:hypothetical protein